MSSSGSSANPYLYNASSGFRSDGDGPANTAPLQKVGARYYDVQFGCFLTRDTELGQKPYAYCDGDPVNFSDPSGHKKKWWEFWKNGNGDDLNPYFTYSIYDMKGENFDQQILHNADNEIAIGGFGSTAFGISGQISTSTIRTRGLTNGNEYGFAIFGGVALGGAAIKAYWATGTALGLWK